MASSFFYDEVLLGKMKAAREEGTEEWHGAAAAWCDVETDIRNQKTEPRHHDRAEAEWHENIKRNRARR